MAVLCEGGAAPPDAGHSVRAHATLGASGAYRWMACPGSVALSHGIPNTSSQYAAEGTAAHEALELCLSGGHDAIEMTGRHFGKCTEFPEGFEVDEEMAEAVQTAIDWVRGNMEPGDVLYLERRFDLTPLAHARPALAAADVAMFGTCDILIWKPELKWLYVADYKHGKGVPVEVRGNTQLRYYALGALETLAGEGVQPEYVHLYVVQPRAFHKDGKIRRERVDVLDLVEWSSDLLDAAEATTIQTPKLAAGGHCGFCPAAHLCPELEHQSKALAVDEFEELSVDAEPTVPDPSALSPERLAFVLDRADILETWLKAVRAHAFGLLNSGGAVPGYKLVQGLGRRKWADEVEAAIVLDELGLADDEYAPRKVISPAEAEKAVGAKLKAQGIKGFAKEAKSKLAGLTITPRAAPTLARDEDPRQAIAGAGTAASEFDAITD
ncbi:DUF2800 domain-containing protein [Azospirillum brasilense]|uniref:DUF2800 domain-containing protein n=1 Tax=Azospirillum brasilense TaxID=192 RepID=A0A235H591_AZOBR|nr:DUF2800 domain-containing protein [Azospirillum brasilense]OYD80961.1 hypothetical protein CHT98_28610 [Azospirillum brasilense]